MHAHVSIRLGVSKTSQTIVESTTALRTNRRRLFLAHHSPAAAPADNRANQSCDDGDCDDGDYDVSVRIREGHSWSRALRASRVLYMSITHLHMNITPLHVNITPLLTHALGRPSFASTVRRVRRLLFCIRPPRPRPARHAPTSKVTVVRVKARVVAVTVV